MEKRDYLLDQINVFAKALALLLSRAMGTDGRIEVLAIRKDFDEALKGRLDLDLEGLLALPEAKLKALFNDEAALSLEEMELLAESLDELADSSPADTSTRMQALSLRMLLHVRAHSNVYSYTREGRIARLEAFLSNEGQR